MNQQPTRNEPIPVGRIVVLFKDSPLGGATLGYYGTVTNVQRRSVEQHPSRPELWVYRVFLSHPGHYVDVCGGNLIVTEDFDPTEPPTETEVNLRFDAAPRSDNEELRGVYRSSLCERMRFEFRKSDQPAPTYEFSMPVEPRPVTVSHLSYNVPRKDVLDRDYVLRAIAQFVRPTDT